VKQFKLRAYGKNHTGTCKLKTVTYGMIDKNDNMSRNTNDGDYGFNKGN